jgi:hypothetical protein
MQLGLYVEAKVTATRILTIDATRLPLEYEPYGVIGGDPPVRTGSNHRSPTATRKIDLTTNATTDATMKKIELTRHTLHQKCARHTHPTMQLGLAVEGN